MALVGPNVNGGMQYRSGGLSGAGDGSHLANGRTAVGRSRWHGICSAGKHWLCFYNVDTQPWFCQCLDRRDFDPRPARAVWSRDLDWHSWCCVVPRECTTPLSHYRYLDPDLPLRLRLAWSLGWAASDRVRYRPTRHSYFGNNVGDRPDRHCHVLYLVPAGADPGNAVANAAH